MGDNAGRIGKGGMDASMGGTDSLNMGAVEAADCPGAMGGGRRRDVVEDAPAEPSAKRPRSSPSSAALHRGFAGTGDHYNGTIKSFSNAKGFGFIQCSTFDSDIYFV